MTLQQLNDVIAIAETGSFNRAAERLYIAQPSLTSAIKELEKELEIKQRSDLLKKAQLFM